ncbi:hypothetical protein [Chitinophaga sp. CF418]|uniref:hypothetical protein n=1 Tax=Chitinophaga sp. CF418 TaxID=1855287 RepID=UPI000914AA39|nr:hypothetical protein [Chitinophaga sp. CF418]SHN45579.1 hypothetical protein SAMN05216311_120117 [Chitinophaga sp. CF418]
MKRSNKNSAAQSLLHFPNMTHDAPRLAATVNRYMRSGTAYSTVSKSGTVFSVIRKPQSGVSRGKLILSKNPLIVKRYTLSDNPADERFYPAFMTDSVKVRLLAIEFRKELPFLVARLTEYCTAIIEKEEAIKLAWPARYIHRFCKWVKLVKKLYAKIADHSEIVTDPAKFARVLMRGKAQSVVIDFIMKYEARSNSKKFSNLVKQFFM